jgi:hypothetical protein
MSKHLSLTNRAIIEKCLARGQVLLPKNYHDIINHSYGVSLTG